MLALAIAMLLTGLHRHGGISSQFQIHTSDLSKDSAIGSVLLARFAISLLSGAALGLAGTLFQMVFRNPLAEPTTIGVMAGANLALIVATLYAPTLLEKGGEWVPYLGGMTALIIVLGVGWQKSLSPIALIIAGLVVNLAASAMGSVLIVANHESLTSLFAWQTGLLTQISWNPTKLLAVQALPLAIISAFLVRPITLLELGDSQAAALGVPTRVVIIAGLSVGVGLTAAVVGAVGAIGFVGLAAPHLCRVLGARRPANLLLWSPAIGGSLLCVTDQLLQTFSLFSGQLPTGAATSILGAPILLLLLRRLPPSHPAAATPLALQRPPVRYMNNLPFVLLGGALACAVAVAICVGQSPSGWAIFTGDSLSAVLPWRAPRVAGALVSGAMLATAGVIMQRMTGNLLASPEVLGISSGASLGLIIVMFIVPGFDRATMLGSTTIGAALTLLILLSINAAARFSPERLLLAGLMLAAILNAAVAFVLASGDPRGGLLIAWMSGSTYRLGWSEVAICAAIALPIAATIPYLTRWLDILPLGDSVARSIGIRTGFSRLILLLVSSLLTAGGTLLVGPLSFVGLMAPQLVRLLGVRRPASQIVASAFIGAIIMILADWIGRNFLFPYQIPAGLIATLIGCPVFLWLIRR